MCFSGLPFRCWSSSPWSWGTSWSDRVALSTLCRHWFYEFCPPKKVNFQLWISVHFSCFQQKILPECRLDDIANLCQLCFSGVGLLVGNRCALTAITTMMIVINGWLMHQNFILAVFGQTTSTSNGLTKGLVACKRSARIGPDWNPQNARSISLESGLYSSARGIWDRCRPCAPFWSEPQCFSTAFRVGDTTQKAVALSAP